MSGPAGHASSRKRATAIHCSDEPLPHGRQRPTHARSPTADPRQGPSPCLYLAVSRECSRGAISWTQRLLLLLLPLRGRRANPLPRPAGSRPLARASADARWPIPHLPPSSRGRALRARPNTRRQRLQRSSTAARVKRLRTAWARFRTQCPLGLLLQLPRPLCPMVANGRPARPTSSVASLTRSRKPRPSGRWAAASLAVADDGEALPSCLDSPRRELSH